MKQHRLERGERIKGSELEGVDIKHNQNICPSCGLPIGTFGHCGCSY